MHMSKLRRTCDDRMSSVSWLAWLFFSCRELPTLLFLLIVRQPCFFLCDACTSVMHCDKLPG